MDDLHSLKFMEFYGIYGILCEVMNEVLWNFMEFYEISCEVMNEVEGICI